MFKVFVPMLVLLTAAAAGSGCLQVDARLPQTCFLQSDLTLAPPAEVGVQARAEAERLGIELLDILTLPTVSVETSFSRDGLDDIPRTLDDIGAEARVVLTHVDILTEPGALRGLERMTLGMRPTDPTSTLPATILAQCADGSGCDGSGDTIGLVGDSEQDLMPYLATGELEFTLELILEPPTEPLELGVDVCMQGEGKVQYGL